jgi:spore coat polysaccharide biosynthesis protein SpsF
MKVLAIIQARMGSTRLPGKVLKDIGVRTMLERVVTRTHRAKLLDGVVVATTTELADNDIESLCQRQNWPCFRGSKDDCLDRYFQAASKHDAETVVRITADCPLIDPQLVDRVVQEFIDRQPQVDYASNVFPSRTFPRGLDAEVIRLDALERVWREDKNPLWREHVTVYIHRNPDLFRIHGVVNDLDYSHMRWTVDTPEDLTFVRRIYDHLDRDEFSWLDVLEVLRQYPEWLDINRHVEQGTV